MEEQPIHILLFNYFSGHSTPEEEQAIWQWLEADEQHKKVFTEMSDWWATVHVPWFDSGKRADFIRHFSAVQTARNVREKRFHIHLLGEIAASLLVLVTLGAVSFQAGKQSFREEESVVFLETHVPFGGNNRITLPDETQVWINTGSTLTYTEDRKKISGK